MSACLFLTAAFISAPAAGEWLDGDELAQACRELNDPATNSTDDINGTLCVAYLQGFIAGSTVAGVQKTDPVATDTGDETFSERAVRTRAESYVRRYEERLHRTHCVGDDVPVHAVVEAITAYLESQPDDPDITAHAIVH
ncbi:MAG: Rap1a/Tai family immunity protein, partial [Woeseiaceae bacterium]